MGKGSLVMRGEGCRLAEIPGYLFKVGIPRSLADESGEKPECLPCLKIGFNGRRTRHVMMKFDD